MSGALEILSALVFTATGLSVFACVLLAGRADKLMNRLPMDSEFEEA